MCIDPDKHAPSSGTYGISELSSSRILAKVLYWGDLENRYARSESYFAKHHTDWSPGKKWIVCHLAAGLAEQGRSTEHFHGASAQTMSWARDLFDYAEKKGDVLRLEFHIN